MITCSNCRKSNRPAAFFCKRCGHALACPRCRVILQDPGDYCDNCGQALAADTLFAAAPLSQSQARPLESPRPEPAPESPSLTAPAATSQERPVTSGQSRLDQFVPHELMAKLEAARAGGGMEGERRVVTMLFFDVKGSTAAAERLDPEEWTEIINGAFEHMIKPVYKYEGTVARLMGDAILAFFGAPIAHEDDPQRAVLAGLDIVANIDPYRESVESKWGIDFNVRVGINTGVVVVGAVGSDLRMEYTAMGDAVNLASRMEQSAMPGTVQIAEETYKLVAPLFDFKELGGIEVKGKEKPVLAYRVLRQKAVPGRLRGFGGTSTPLVGRQDALRRLTAAIERVQQGNSQILFITGEVGLGKSRLIEELSREWDEAIATYWDAAFRLYANAGAVEHYTQALEAAAKIPEGDAAISTERLTHLCARRGRALELDARIQEAVENYEAMRQKAQQLDARGMELAALMSMATQYATPTSFYNFELAESLSQQAVQLAQDLNDRPAEAKILWNLSNMNRFSGLTKEALEAGESALAIARELDLREQIAFSLNDLSHLYSRTGRYEKSKAALQEANDLWRELDNLPMLTDSLSTASYVYTFTGDYGEAVAFSEEALSISESIGNIWGLSYSQFVVGKVYWERGEPERAIRVMKDSIHYAEKAGFTVAQAYTRADLAMAYGRLGDIDQAFAIAKEAQKYAVDDRRSFEPYILSQLARLHLINGDTVAAAEAVGALRAEDRPVHLNRPEVVTLAECELPFHRGDYGGYLEAIRLLEERLGALRRYGMKSFLPETLYLLGQAFATADQLDQALSTLEDGLQEARSLGSRWAEWQLLAGLAGLKDGEQASLWRAEALESVTVIADNVGDPELRQSFLSRPDIQQLTALRSE